MKITPIEIRQKKFEKSFRGYDKEGVNAFLQSLSQEWESLNNDLKTYKIKLEAAEKELKQLREVESSLFKTLKTAEDTGSSMVEQAKKEAELQLKDAQIQSNKIIQDADNKAKQIIQNADKKALNTLQEMISELKKMEASCNTLENYKDNLVIEIKNLAKYALEKAEKLEAKDLRLDISQKITETNNEIHQMSEQSASIEFEINVQESEEDQVPNPSDKLDEDGSFFDQVI